MFAFSAFHGRFKGDSRVFLKDARSMLLENRRLPEALTVAEL